MEITSTIVRNVRQENCGIFIQFDLTHLSQLIVFEQPYQEWLNDIECKYAPSNLHASARSCFELQCATFGYQFIKKFLVEMINVNKLQGMLFIYYSIEFMKDTIEAEFV